LARLARPAEAIESFNKARDLLEKLMAQTPGSSQLKLELGNTDVDLSWLLATCSNPKYKNAQRAIEVATQASELTEWKNPNALSNLAAVYAQAEDFAAAVEWQTKALELLNGQPGWAQAAMRVEGYKVKKAFREIVKNEKPE